MQDDYYVIGIPVYDQVDLMDVAAPYELFNWMVQMEKSPPGKGRKVQLISVDGPSVRTRDGLMLGDALSTLEQAGQVDLLWVPGGDPARLALLMEDQRLMDFLRRQSAGAEYTTSVCEGALLLAAAGLLDGYCATTHWNFYPCLRRFPKIKVVQDYPRYVVDGNRITGGGISAGLDEALMIIAILAGDDLARQVQKTVQYNPKPPFPGGDPSQSGSPAHACMPALSQAITRILAQQSSSA